MWLNDKEEVIFYSFEELRKNLDFIRFFWNDILKFY